MGGGGVVPDGWMDGAVTMEAAGGGPAGWCGGTLERLRKTVGDVEA